MYIDVTKDETPKGDVWTGRIYGVMTMNLET